MARAISLCRQEGIDYMLNARGDLVLEPPLKGKKILFRALPGLKAEVSSLMENLKGRLQGQGAQVISCPVMPGDEELLRFRTGDVLLSWASCSRDLPVTVRFFSSPRRKGESLRLIACLTEALLQVAGSLYALHLGAFQKFHLPQEPGQTRDSRCAPGMGAPECAGEGKGPGPNPDVGLELLFYPAPFQREERQN